MKDYYKILGIRKTAPEESIRARWIELMRKFHYDGKRMEGAEDRRLKEINEAYGVLKHSSTRIEYDLKRAYNRKKRSLYLRRLTFLPAILIVFIILGLVYLKGSQVSLLAQSTTPSAQGSTGIKVNPPSSPLTHAPNALNEINKINQINEMNQTNQTNQILVQLKPASLIATEEEVRDFFDHYIEQYTEKDIDGFLILFSSKAVQNERDGFDEIKKIYADFFDQSHKLRYHMEDTRISIFQNAVRVKSRYKVDQILKKGRKKKVWKGDIRWILVRENGALKIRYLDYKEQKSP